MSWIIISEDSVLTGISGAEASALKTAALGVGQAEPLALLIGKVIKEVRGYVAAGGFTLGAGLTVPDELESAAIAIIRYRAWNRLPTSALLTPTRQKEYEEALELLKSVAKGQFRIVPADTADVAQAAALSPTFTRRRKRFGHCQEDGL